MITRWIHSFFGGVHPPENKNASAEQPLLCQTTPFAPRLILPLLQGSGQAGLPCVQVGEYVLKYQPLTRVTDPHSTPIHAPTSGRIIALEPHLIPHPSGQKQTCFILEPDQKDTPYPYPRLAPDASAETIRNYLQQAGIVGLGGAAFSTHLKTKQKTGLNALILNGAECEPWITCDDVLMRTRAVSILHGGQALAQLMDAKKIYLAIEDNKPAAIQAMQQARDHATSPIPLEIVIIPTLYPSGSAKQLIKILTGIEIPAGQRATDFHIQCFNVGTAFAVYEAFHHAKPLVSRVVTVTGNVAHPQNIEILLGTPLATLLDIVGGAHADTERFIMGGPMMGLPLPDDLSIPVIKSTNCILASSPTLFPPPPPAMPCIRCGECARVCPMELQPMDLYWYSRAKQFDQAKKFYLFDCIECGCCSYVCPSHIPLVDYYRFAKSEIRAEAHAQQQADQARKRHEARQLRLEQEKQERAERLARKSLQATSETPVTIETQPATDGPATAIAPPPSPSEADAKKAAIAAAVARAKTKKEAAVSPEETPPPSEADAKKAAIAAAVARAKAKKEAAVSPEETPSPSEADAKKAAIAAAVARAKAKKEAAALQKNSETPS